MSDCDTNARMVGRSSVMNVAIQNTTNDPSTSTLLPLGAVTTKGLSINGNIIEVNDSSNSSGFTESQMAGAALTITISGNYIRDPDLYPNYTTVSGIFKHFVTCTTSDLSSSPVILVEYVRPDITVLGYMIVNSIDIDDPSADLSTFTMTLSTATSPTYPLAVTDTEDEEE